MTTQISATAVLVVFMMSLGQGSAQEPLSIKDLWQGSGFDSGVFTIDDNSLKAKRRTYQSATVTSKIELENFDLEFEFLLERWCELVLAIHVPANAAYRAGLELVLSDHAGSGPSPFVAGALLRDVAPKNVSVHKAGQWNQCTIHMDWPQFRVELNGVEVQNIDLSENPALRHKLRRGAIVFRDLLGWGFKVRNLRLQKLQDTERGIVLFNGKDLTGWKEVRPGDARWTVAHNAIIGTDGNGYLQHERLSEDFDLRLMYRSTPTANGGVFFRWKPDDSDRGNEIQILDVAQSLMPSASIYSITRANDAPIRPGEWNLLQLSVRGSHAITHLNGIKTAQTDRLTKIWPGLITLQMHKEKTTIEFKDLVLVIHEASDTAP